MLLQKEHEPESRFATAMAAAVCLISRIACGAVLDRAFAWLCIRRQNYSHNNDVWNLRRNWGQQKTLVQGLPLSGAYSFQPLREHRLDGEAIELWSSRDVLVLKAMAIVLSKYLSPVISCRCHYTAGRGGAKAVVRHAFKALDPNLHIMKSDVRGTYASMDHEVLLEIVARYVSEPAVLRLIRGYLQRTVTFGENYREARRGISLGCPLSPLMGALYLLPLDEAMQKNARFMDDWLILAPTRWKLRAAVRTVRQVLEQLKVAMHPDKTCIGMARRGFDLLGCHFQPDLLTVSPAAIQQCAQRLARLYEQGADSLRAGRYVRRWIAWARAGTANLIDSQVLACRLSPILEEYAALASSNYQLSPLRSRRARAYGSELVLGGPLPAPSLRRPD